MVPATASLPAPTGASTAAQISMQAELGATLQAAALLFAHNEPPPTPPQDAALARFAAAAAANPMLSAHQFDGRTFLGNVTRSGLAACLRCVARLPARRPASQPPRPRALTLPPPARPQLYTVRSGSGGAKLRAMAARFKADSALIKALAGKMGMAQQAAGMAQQAAGEALDAAVERFLACEWAGIEQRHLGLLFILYTMIDPDAFPLGDPEMARIMATRNDLDRVLKLAAGGAAADFALDASA